LVAPAKSISLKTLRWVLLSYSDDGGQLSAERNSFWYEVLQLLQFSMINSAKSEATNACRVPFKVY